MSIEALQVKLRPQACSLQCNSVCSVSNSLTAEQEFPAALVSYSMQEESASLNLYAVSDELHCRTDTIRTVEGYADVIVLRHFQAGSSATAASVSSIPIINAGDGPGQHPTQVIASDTLLPGLPS